MSLESSLSVDIPTAKRPRTEADESVVLVPPPIYSNPTNITMNSSTASKRLTFHDDIEEMLFGFGDAWPPSPDVIEMMDRIVYKYIEDLGLRAEILAEVRGKVEKECFLFLVRKDRDKFYRIDRLLKANESLKKVRTITYEESAEI